jgi:hypothetical protein
MAIIGIVSSDAIMKIVKQEQNVISDQYDTLKARLCDEIDEQKAYHINRLATLAKVFRNVK